MDAKAFNFYYHAYAVNGKLYEKIWDYSVLNQSLIEKFAVVEEPQELYPKNGSYTPTVVTVRPFERNG